MTFTLPVVGQRYTTTWNEPLVITDVDQAGETVWIAYDIGEPVREEHHVTLEDFYLITPTGKPRFTLIEEHPPP